MEEIDFSGYLKGTSPGSKKIPQNNKKTVSKRRKTIYIAIILFCVAATIILGRSYMKQQLPVENTLPPGVPLEAPPLDQLPPKGG